MAADGVRTGRLPIVAVGALESTVGAGGVRGVVSDSGAWVGDMGSGTEEAAQENKLCDINFSIIGTKAKRNCVCATVTDNFDKYL